MHLNFCYPYCNFHIVLLATVVLKLAQIQSTDLLPLRALSEILMSVRMYWHCKMLWCGVRIKSIKLCFVSALSSLSASHSLILVKSFEKKVIQHIKDNPSSLHVEQKHVWYGEHKTHALIRIPLPPGTSACRSYPRPPGAVVYIRVANSRSRMYG